MKFNISVFIATAFISSFSAHAIPYAPEGSLYDNEQYNGISSIASQISSTTFSVRTADDFTLSGAACPSGIFDISQIRVQMTQNYLTPQAFGVDIYADNGSGTAPVSGINPSHTFTETSQSYLMLWNVVLDLFEASFDTPGLTLAADTPYWLSGFGADGAANTGGFNNFIVTSAGAVGTTANGVLISPDNGFPDWLPLETALGGSPGALSFAIDGSCAPSLSECTANDLNCIGTYINYKRAPFCDLITKSDSGYFIPSLFGTSWDTANGAQPNDIDELIRAKCFNSPS